MSQEHPSTKFNKEFNNNEDEDDDVVDVEKKKTIFIITWSTL